MPELPEVETIVCELKNANLLHKKIIRAEVLWPRTLLPPDIETFCKEIQGKEILSIARRGKYIAFTLSKGFTLFVHLRMTGRFAFTPNDHVRVSLHFSGGIDLYYIDARKFGKWSLVKNQEDIIGHLGPEPLEESFTAAEFFNNLQSKKRKLKPLLLDQTFIAGLGNIYVDEALWEAKLHPEQTSEALTAKKSADLLKSIRYVLTRGLQTQGTTLGKGKSNYYRLEGEKGNHQDSLSVFRKTGLPCPRCGTIIKRIIVGQRSTHFCPKCQQITST